MEPSGSNIVHAGSSFYSRSVVNRKLSRGGGGRGGDTSSSEHYATKKYEARKCKID